MAKPFIYSQETPTEAEDFGCISVSDEGDAFTVTVGPSKACYWDVEGTVQLYDEQARELVAWLQGWLAQQKY